MKCAVLAFSLQGHTVTAKVVDWHDGDTFKAIFFLPGTIVVVRFSPSVDTLTLNKQFQGLFWVDQLDCTDWTLFNQISDKCHNDDVFSFLGK